MSRPALLVYPTAGHAVIFSQDTYKKSLLTEYGVSWDAFTDFLSTCSKDVAFLFAFSIIKTVLFCAVNNY